ncbi:potassium channel family protein [Halobacillus sp. H74]|uniref:potassium channel family protein n=1 Tax=Halobacillus sp. H74 TaxID=3457436 RepID=UPI003FCD3D39
MYQNHKRLYQFTLILILLILITVIGFMQIEKLPFFDSLWMTVVSVLALGYGDYVPSQTMGKVLAMVLIPITMGFTTYILTYIAASMIEGRLSKKWERKKRMKQLEKMKDHYIICGYERVGEQVLKELNDHGSKIVIIETDDESLERIPEDVPYLIGDAKHNDVLQKAGIDRAKGLLATTSNDATNVFITLTAKGLNEEAEVIARAENGETIDKLKRAGADHVVNPSDLGGRRMALSLIKPVSMHYVDSLIHAESNRYQIEEYVIKATSSLCYNKVSELSLKQEFGISLLGIQRNGSFMSNPSEDDEVHRNDVFVMFGETQELQRFFNEND